MKYRVTRSTTTMATYDVEAANEADAIAAALGPGMLTGAADLWSAVALGPSEPLPEPILGPQGFGVYLRRIKGGEAEAHEVAERCSRAGFAWAALMVESSDGYRVPLTTTTAYADALSERNIRVYVWTFPGTARASSLVESIAAGNLALNYAKAVDADGVIADVEAAYKGKPEELHALLETIKMGMGGGKLLGVASYPVPSMHPTIPWNEMRLAHFGSPMFYETAQKPALVDKGLAEWAEITLTIVPVLDGWTGDDFAGGVRLRTDIVTVCGKAPTPRVRAASIWSEAQMDDAKRAVVSAMAEAYDWRR